MKLKKGDKVFILSGKDKRKTGTVSRVIMKSGKVVVDGVNIVKKTVKGDKSNPRGGMVEKPMPLNISNVQVVCISCGKSSKLGYKLLKNGKKERICKKCGQAIKEQK